LIKSAPLYSIKILLKCLTVLKITIVIYIINHLVNIWDLKEKKLINVLKGHSE